MEITKQIKRTMIFVLFSPVVVFFIHRSELNVCCSLCCRTSPLSHPKSLECLYHPPPPARQSQVPFEHSQQTRKTKPKQNKSLSEKSVKKSSTHPTHTRMGNKKTKTRKPTDATVTVIDHPPLPAYPKHFCAVCDQLLMRNLWGAWYCFRCRCAATPSS